MAAAAILFAVTASAGTITVVPASPTAMPGDNIVLSVMASDVELGGYDLSVGFNPVLSSFVSRVYGHALNDTFIRSDGPAGLDTVEVSELSFEGAGVLSPLQGSPFLLATLTFRADAAGTAVFTLTRANADAADLTDFGGNALDGTAVVLSGASVVIGTPEPAPVPEPSTGALVIGGLLAVRRLRK